MYKSNDMLNIKHERVKTRNKDICSLQQRKAFDSHPVEGWIRLKIEDGVVKKEV